MSQKKSGHIADNADKENKEDSLVPNGELKWRKDEEDLQDADMTLQQDTEHETKEKEESTRQKKQSEPQKSEDKATQKEQTTTSAQENKSKDKTEKTDKELETDQKQKDKLTSEKESAASAEVKKEYTIEDTLGPIDFKEYSVKLESEEKKKEETKSPDQVTFVFKKEKKEKTRRKPITREKVKTPKIELPKWKFALRILWLPISLVFALFIGLIVGNTVIGEQPVSEAFNIENWIHLYKLIFTK